MFAECLSAKNNKTLNESVCSLEKKLSWNVDDPIGLFIEKVVVMVFLDKALLTIFIVYLAFAYS
jgi:hypothetical protein